MFELRLLGPEPLVETLSDALEALDALSVSVEDADADSSFEQALFGEPDMPAPKGGWQRSLLVAIFSSEAMASEAASLLRAQPFFADCSVVSVTEIPDQDWVRLTQSQFAPVEITPHFWIVPTWHTAPEQARVTMTLDPGLAFGTGTHPTTRMCLHWIATQPLAGRVLDYGCGSGILAIGAAKFGATEVLAVDIDEAAIGSTQTNAEVNGVQLLAGMPEVAQGSFDVVIANILATPLKVLAPLLCARVRPGGRLVLAGILERQAQELIDAYAPFCQLSTANQQDGWILMTATL